MSFNRALFAKLVRIKMAEEDLDCTETGTILRVSAATVSRMSRKEGAGTPDLETFAKTCRWLEVNPFEFITEGDVDNE